MYLKYNFHYNSKTIIYLKKHHNFTIKWIYIEKYISQNT